VRAKEGPLRSWLFAFVVAVASALVLGVAPSAQATTNVVPNPGFESDCAGVPCDWSAAGGATILRDTSTFHSGLASLKVSGSANTTPVATTGCIPLSPGDHAASFWHNYTLTNLDSSPVLAADFSDMANCSTFLGSDVLVSGNPGSWLQATGTLTAPPGTVAATFLFQFHCTTDGACSANFDDVDVEAELLAVTLSSFSARRLHKGVVVRWRTGSEVDSLGFNVYRQRGGHRVRLNRHVIPALSLTRGGVSGGSYSYRDRHPPKHRALRYWLQEVAVDGTRTWHGPVRVGAS
jgi:hypothetical protein